MIFEGVRRYGKGKLHCFSGSCDGTTHARNGVDVQGMGATRSANRIIELVQEAAIPPDIMPSNEVRSSSPSDRS